MRITVIVLMIFMGLSACTKMHIGWSYDRMLPANFNFEPPPGPEIYQQGWVDGCGSGFSGYGNLYNKIFNDFKQDPELAQNPVYYQIWKDAYAYCANYAMLIDEHGLGNWNAK